MPHFGVSWAISPSPGGRSQLPPQPPRSGPNSSDKGCGYLGSALSHCPLPEICLGWFPDGPDTILPGTVARGPREHGFQTSTLEATFGKAGGQGGRGWGLGRRSVGQGLRPGSRLPAGSLGRPGGGRQPAAGIPSLGWRLRPAAAGLRPGRSCGPADSTHHLTPHAGPSGGEVPGRLDGCVQGQGGLGPGSLPGYLWGRGRFPWCRSGLPSFTS